MANTEPAEPVLPQRRFTVEEYLDFEEASEEKHEYRDGYVYHWQDPLGPPLNDLTVPPKGVLSMAGGTVEHAGIAVNVASEMRQRLKGGPCRPYTSDLRVGYGRRRQYGYPDVTVICGEPRLAPTRRGRNSSTILNPTLVVEILSDSTESYDRGPKFERYRDIDGFREYVLVAQDRPRVETYYRQDDGTWLFTIADGLDAVARLRSLNVDLPLAEVYAGVAFPPAPPEDDDVA